MSIEINIEDKQEFDDFLGSYGFWIKNAPESLSNTYESLSFSLYGTKTNAKFIRNFMFYRLINDFEHFSRYFGFDSMNKIEFFFKNMHYPEFKSLLLEICANCFQIQIKLHSINGKSLFSEKFGQKNNKSRKLHLIRLSDSHFSRIDKQKSFIITIECQNIVLNLIESVLKGTKIKELKNLNKSQLINYDVLNWQKKFIFREDLIEKNSFQQNSKTQVFQIHTHIIEMLHQRKKESQSRPTSPNLEKEKLEWFDFPQNKTLIFTKFNKSLEKRLPSSKKLVNSKNAEELGYEDMLQSELFQIWLKEEGLGHFLPDDQLSIQSHFENQVLDATLKQRIINFLKNLPENQDFFSESQDIIEREELSSNHVSHIQKLDVNKNDVKNNYSVNLSQENNKQSFAPKKSKLVLKQDNQFFKSKILEPNPINQKSKNELKVSLFCKNPKKPSELETKSVVSSISCVTPFFADEEEIQTNKVFSSIINKLSSNSNKNTDEEIDPTVHIGKLKFFDEKNKFGFLSTIINGVPDDIFAYLSEFTLGKVSIEILRTAKQDNQLHFEFNVCTYYGKYKRSKKAANIKLLPL